MIKPNYQDGSIVNLVGSIAQAFGDSDAYAPLSLLSPSTVAEARNVILLIIDGLGYEFFRHHAEGLSRHLRGPITSVFPSSTAPAITSLVTGVGPQQHGVTGWFMQLRELGTVGVILPHRPRHSTMPFDPKQVPVKNLLGRSALFDRLEVSGYYLMHNQLVDSPYSLMAAGGAKRREYHGLSDMFSSLGQIVREHQGSKYVYAYWPMFDALAHRYGIASTVVLDHFQQISEELQRCVAALQGSDTLLIVTADHGFVDTSAETVLRLEDHTELASCLSMPLCGEPRVVYCYVRGNRSADFEGLVSEQLGHAVTLHRAEELVAEGWFGTGKPDHRLLQRIGDYILICKDNYVLKDRLPTERPGRDIGVHGGVSAQEMYVPLLTIAC